MADIEQGAVAVVLAQDAVVPVKRKGNPFKPGHPRYGGRKKGSPIKRTAEAQEIAEKMGFHPVMFLSTIAHRGVMPNADGTETPVDTAMRMDAAKTVSRFLVPTLQATQVTGKDDGPVAVAGLDMTALLASPDAVEAAQKLALMMAKADTDRSDAVEPADSQPDE